MKSKIVIIGLVIIMLFNIVPVLTTDNCKAYTNKNYKLEVEDCKYELVKTVGNGPQTTFDYYKVAFTLYNKGPEDSDNIIVTIQESKEPDRERLIRTGIIPSGESKTFYFGYKEIDDTQWIIQALNTGENYRHKVYVNYFPEDNTSRPTEFNSGNHTFLIGATSGNDSPGFEVIIFIGAMIAIFVFKKKKKRN